MSYKEREKRRREREILLSARRLINENGSADLNMDHLAEMVGISKPTLYQHFRSKDDLVACVLVESFQEIEQYLQTLHDTAPLERLKRVLHKMLVSRYSADGCLAGIEAHFLASSARSHADVIAIKQRVMDAITQAAEDGKARGEIRSTIPTPLITCMLVKLIGLPSLAYDEISAAQPDDPHILAGLIDSVVDLYVRAIAQTTP